MTTAVLNPPQELESIADLIDRLGVSADRILLHPPPGTATAADVIRLADRHDRLCELIDGVLVEKVMGRHESTLALHLGYFVISFLKDNDVGLVTGPDGPNQTLPKQIRYPDFAFVSYDTLGTRDPSKAPIAPWVPDLIVEIISRGNTKKEMLRKLEEYFAAGVKLVWYVYPKTKTVRVYTSPDDCTELSEDNVLTGGEVLPGFELSIREWFTAAK